MGPLSADDAQAANLATGSRILSSTIDLDAYYAWTPPPPAPPESIQRYQFYQQLALTPDPNKTDGSTIITEDEAVAGIVGTPPPELAALISQLPAGEQFSARVLLAGAPTFELHNPLTQAIARGYGWTEDQLNNFWLAASRS